MGNIVLAAIIRVLLPATPTPKPQALLVVRVPGKPENRDREALLNGFTGQPESSMTWGYVVLRTAAFGIKVRFFLVCTPRFALRLQGVCPKGPCAQLVYTLAPKYPYRDYFKASVYSIP